MPDSARTLCFVPDPPPSERFLQMAPLIDIVFLLICFYLLVSQLMTRQKDPQVELPVMANPVTRQERPAEFVINVRADGTVVVDGRATSLAGFRAELARRLERALARDLPLRVVVRADRRGRFAELDEVLQSCRQAGVAKVTLRTQREAGP